MRMLSKVTLQNCLWQAVSLEKSKQSKRPLDILYAKIALPQIPVFQLRIIFVIKKKKKKSLGAGGRTLYEAAL